MEDSIVNFALVGLLPLKRTLQSGTFSSPTSRKLHVSNKQRICGSSGSLDHRPVLARFQRKPSSHIGPVQFGCDDGGEYGVKKQIFQCRGTA